MSSFTRVGFRKSKATERAVVKKHTKSFYRILGEMDVVAKQLDSSLEYNEENINEYVLPIYGRELDNMEKMLVLGKLHHSKENKNENKNKTDSVTI